MATEKVTIYRKYHGKVPTDKTGKPLHRKDWTRKRSFRWAVRWFGSERKRYSRSFKNRKEAERFAEIKQLEIRNGRVDPPPPTTFQEFVKEHKKVMCGQVAHRTLSDQMRALNKFMSHVGGNMQFKKISPIHAESFISSRLVSGRAVCTVNKDIRTLKSIFNRAIELRGYLPQGHNPFKNIKQRRTAGNTVRYVSVEEYQALMNAAQDVYWKALLSVAYGCGLRREEILNLIWGNIDFENQRIHVSPKKKATGVLEWEPKDHEARILPMPVQTMSLLIDLQALSVEGCPYVFVPNWRWERIQKKQLSGEWKEEQAIVNNFGRIFHKLRIKAKVTECTLHDLRRSCITNWAQVLPIHVVQKLAGHSDIKTTQKYYLAVRQEDMEKARIAQSKILSSDLTDPLLTHCDPKTAFLNGQEWS